MVNALGMDDGVHGVNFHGNVGKTFLLYWFASAQL